MYIPKGVAEQKRLIAKIAAVERKLGKDVVRLRYTIGTDWSDQPAIYFRVLLSDEASRPEGLHDVAKRIRDAIEKGVDPLNSWGLMSYVNFRSQSEQEMLKEPSWA